MPMIAPSMDCRRATVCPQGSVCASCSSVKPFSFNSSAPTWTASASPTSNSMLACGTGRSAGQSGVPKQACAACVSGQTPKLLLPSMSSTVQIVIFRPHQWEPKPIHVEPSADARVRGDHCDTRDELHIHDVTFRHCFDSSDDRRILL